MLSSNHAGAPRRGSRRCSWLWPCSPRPARLAPPVGAVGATLAAMDGTVTLDKVISPAPVVAGSIGAPFGHKLVAVVLTVHSPGLVGGEIRRHLRQLEARRLQEAGAHRPEHGQVQGGRLCRLPTLRHPGGRSVRHRVRGVRVGARPTPGGAEDLGQGQGGLDDRADRHPSRHCTARRGAKCPPGSPHGARDRGQDDNDHDARPRRRPRRACPGGPRPAGRGPPRRHRAPGATTTSTTAAKPSVSPRLTRHHHGAGQGPRGSSASPPGCRGGARVSISGRG